MTPTAGPPVMARWSGWCSRCLAPIRPGDTIRVFNNTWTHGWHWNNDEEDE